MMDGLTVRGSEFKQGEGGKETAMAGSVGELKARVKELEAALAKAKADADDCKVR